VRWFFLALMVPLLACGADRVILGLYSSDDYDHDQDHLNLVSAAMELPLNYLGVAVRLHDITKGVPTPAQMDGVLGILCCSTTPQMKDPIPFCKWLISQVRGGRPLVIVGQLPFLYDASSGRQTPLSLVSGLLEEIGLSYGGGPYADPVDIVYSQHEMMGFERRLQSQDVTDYTAIHSNAPDNQVYVELKTERFEQISAVVTSPKGGLALLDCALYLAVNNGQMQWLLDPFLFFERGFGLGGKPRFDTTTLWGRRIFYSHIDGDGVRNITRVAGYRNCGEVILDEVLRGRHIPITVSFVTAELDREILGNRYTMKIAQESFALPHIEPAVHGFSHPLDWKRRLTTFAVPNYSVEIDPDDQEMQALLKETLYDMGAVVIVPWEEYLRAETVRAADFLNKTFSVETKVNLWTGNCLPPAEAISMVDERGLRNMNGGDGRFDRAHPSYTQLAALVRHVGGLRQIHTSNANETIYTNDWTGPFYGIIHVIETYKQTEYPTLIDGPPRRVSPMNLYYHFYSGEREESLLALGKVYDYAEKSEPICLWVSDYCDIVDGFFSADMSETSEGWSFSNYGACSTVRFDDEERFVDLDRSKGVLGFARWEKSLYVHLVPGGPATLVWSEQAPTQPYLIDSNVPLSSLSIRPGEIEFTARGFQSAELRFANLPPDTEFEVGDQTFKSDPSGALTVDLPINGTQSVVVTAR